MSAPALVPNAGEAAPFGAHVTPNGVNFAVYSEHATAIFVCLFDADDNEIVRISLDGHKDAVWFGCIAMDPSLSYGLRADGLYAPEKGLFFDPDKLLIDPYALRIDRPFHHDERLALPRGEAGDTAALMPKALIDQALPDPIQPLKTRPGGLTYELNVKTFTQLHRDLPEELRGKVAGLASAPNRRHLQTLGVDIVELMPVAAWIDERHLQPLGLRNVWGYNPVGYFIPDPDLMPHGISDLRAMTDAYRSDGLPVILDVVYNHTGEGDRHGPVLSMRGLDALTYYWYTQHHDQLVVVNDSGTGNTLSCGHPAVMQLVIDSLKFWVERGGVSGFRFDLAPILGKDSNGFDAHAPLLETMRNDPVLSQCLLVAEPWDASGNAYQLGDFGKPFEEWNDRYRDDVRAFWRGDDHKIGDFAQRLSGSADIFGGKDRGPHASVNMLAVHDGFTLADTVSYTEKHNEPNGEDNRDGHSHNLSWNNGVEGATDDATILAARDRDVRALLATLFVSLGTPLMQQGDEMGRTQDGMNNAYAQDNDITWVDWDGADEQLIAFTAALKQFRDTHPAITADRFLSGETIDGVRDVIWWHRKGHEFANADWHHPKSGVLGMQLCRDHDEVLVWFNRTHASRQAKLPMPQSGKHGWEVALTSASKAPRIVKSEIKLPARSVILLVPGAR